MVKEITVGIGHSAVKAGVIGECGCSYPIPFHPEEKKVIVGAARAQAITGAALSIHPSSGDWMLIPDSVTEAESYLDLMEKEGADLAKFYLSHADSTCGKLKYHQRPLERGITLCYDNFGKEYYCGSLSLVRSDKERVRALSQLCKQGYDKQLLMSHDVCLKMDFRSYGGHGYVHVLEHIVPCLRNEGVSNKAIANMLLRNPARLLAM